MTEETLSSKMAEFLTAIDQVKKYRKLVSAIVDFALIIIVSVAGLLTLHLVVNLLNLYGISNITSNSWGVAFSNILIPCIGVIIGVVWVGRKIDTVKTQQWTTTLNEGTPGALKLLQETNWETIFSDIRFAKLGFAFYGAIKVAAYWLIAFFAFVVLSSFLGNIVHFSFDAISLLVVPLVFVLIFSLKDLRNRYEQVGRLDSLLWELRWFESEFRRTDFQT
ncbi:MAG: hypothetical protein LBH79_09025 [Nitrososphaerota archaeon]|nr:hypothetical protein [Nitrososphaerota archaeon]